MMHFLLQKTVPIAHCQVLLITIIIQYFFVYLTFNIVIKLQPSIAEAVVINFDFIVIIVITMDSSFYYKFNFIDCFTSFIIIVAVVVEAIIIIVISTLIIDIMYFSVNFNFINFK